MVNLGFNLTTLLGLLDLLGVIGYFVLAISQISRGAYSSNSTFNTAIQLLELLVSPIALFFSGIILIFNGWRLDPILLLQQLLLHVIIGLSFIKMLGQLANSSR
jgi:hypothetical protein